MADDYMPWPQLNDLVQQQQNQQWLEQQYANPGNTIQKPPDRRSVLEKLVGNRPPPQNDFFQRRAQNVSNAISNLIPDPVKEAASNFRQSRAGRLFFGNPDVPTAGAVSVDPDQYWLQLARMLENQRASPQQIWDVGVRGGQGGLFRQIGHGNFQQELPGPWGFKMNPWQMVKKYNMNIGGSSGSPGAPLGEIYNFPSLYNKYPHMKNIPFHWDPELGAGFMAGYHPKEDALYFGAPAFESRMAFPPGSALPASPDEVMHHEIQHLVDKHLGHYTGMLSSDQLNLDISVGGPKRKEFDKHVNSLRQQFPHLSDENAAHEAFMRVYLDMPPEQRARVSGLRSAFSPQRRAKEHPTNTFGDMLTREDEFHQNLMRYQNWQDRPSWFDWFTSRTPPARTP